MKCKECFDTMCKYRTVDAEKGCELVKTVKLSDTGQSEIVVPRSDDLEKEFNRFLDEKEGMPLMWRSDDQLEWALDIARHFAEWQKQRMIDKACNWLKENAANYVSKDNQGEPYLFRIGLADAFIKAMKQ